MSNSLRTWSWAGLMAFAAIAEWHALTTTIQLSLERDEYAHIVLIVPVAVALLWLGWRKIASKAASDNTAGTLVMCVAIAVAFSARCASSPDLHLFFLMFALVTWCIGGFLPCFGRQSFLAALFPLMFLYLLVPWPDALLDVIIPWLQRESALSARALFALARIPVTLEDVTLYLPNLTLNVAPECSSMRSSMMLIITTLIFAQLFLRSVWRKAFLVFTAILLSPLKNGLRIFVVGSLALRNPAQLSGWIHLHGGVVFLAIAQGIVFLLLWFLRKGDHWRELVDPAANSH